MEGRERNSSKGNGLRSWGGASGDTGEQTRGGIWDEKNKGGGEK